MSVLTRMAEKKLDDIQDRLSQQHKVIGDLEAQLAEAKEDRERWTAEVLELTEFLDKQGVKT